jgi:hypothetical protein
LDRELPEHGWPRAALTELLCDAVGIGEVSLVLPAMANTDVRGRGVIWIAPPYLPYAPALAAAGIDLKNLLIVRSTRVSDTLWAAEQSMRAGAAAMVVVWLAHSVDYTVLRRLQLACGTGECAGFIYRASNAARQASPAPLRLALTRSCNALTRSCNALTRSCTPLTRLSDALEGEQALLKLQILKRRGMNAAQPLWLATTVNRLSERRSERIESEWMAIPISD